MGLWRIVDTVRFDLGSVEPAQTRALAVQLVRNLLQERGIQAGWSAPDGRHFLPWDLTPEQVIQRIESEWTALKRDPNIGELAWFTSVE